MKIAVPIQSGNKIAHQFEVCDCFGIFTIDAERKIVDVERITNETDNENRIVNIFNFIDSNQINLIITNQITSMIENKCYSNGICVMKDCEGDVFSSINFFLQQK